MRNLFWTLLCPQIAELVVLPNDNEELWVGSGRHSFTRAYSPATWPPAPIRDFFRQPNNEFIA